MFIKLTILIQRFYKKKEKKNNTVSYTLRSLWFDAWCVSLRLQKTSTAVGGPAFTNDHFARDTADVVIVVPREFLARSNVAQGKESDPREPYIVGINENILYKHVGITGMLKQKKNTHSINFLSRLYCILNKTFCSV